MTRVLGLDLSLTATGYAAGDEMCDVLKLRSKGMRRLAETRTFVLELAADVDVVVLEGYGFMSQKAVVQGELGGVIRLALWDRKIPVVEVAPTTLKKFATGRGNADKGAVIAAAIRRLGFEGDNDNAADAWVLRQMGLVHYDSLPIALPGGSIEALTKVEWPRLELEVSA